MVSANAYVVAWVMLCATLANDDVTSFGKLATEYFYTKSFAVRFTAVLGTTCAFLVCHFISCSLLVNSA